MSTILPSEKHTPSYDGKSEAGDDADKTSLSVASASGIPPLAPLDETPTTLFSRPNTIHDLDSVATQPSVFDNPSMLEAYRPPPQYENSHRFDPLARWSWREEKRVLRKIDLKIMIWASIMFFALDLDRSNISQANTDNFLEDLGLTTDDYNLGNTLFRLSSLRNWCLNEWDQIFGFRHKWVQVLEGGDDDLTNVFLEMTLWSIVASSQFWLTGKSSFLATRFLLGFLQGGFIPDMVLYLSYFYTKRERSGPLLIFLNSLLTLKIAVPIRLAFFWISNYISDIVSAFLATALLQLRGVGGRAGWRYLFLIEGLLTLACGLSSYIMMPAGPAQTKIRWFRPNGWFTERQEVIMVNRILRDDPSKSDMHNREGLSVRMIAQALADWRMWPIYIFGLVHMMPVGPPQQYLTLSLRSLGFSTTEANLLSIPSTVIGMFMLLFTAYLSERINSRVIATVVLQFWALPLLVALYTFNSVTSDWVYFTVVSLITGFPYVHPIQVAWASRNSNSVKTRTVSASIYNMFVQAGAIVYANIYRADDKPLYKRGNRILIAICSMNIILYALGYVFYRYLNHRRDGKWNSWTRKEQEQYIETTKDIGNARMDFRFAF